MLATLFYRVAGNQRCPVCAVKTMPNCGPTVATRCAIGRRTFLRGAGVALALPFLESMVPAFAKSAASDKPRRMLAICNNLGLLPGEFFPTGRGRDYLASPYLKLLQEHRENFTVFTGVSHPNLDGGHPADVCFLTAAPHPGSG